jgi:uncharacterized DUF497 family protein
VALVFHWDERKAASNLRKHGLTFAEAASIFADLFVITVPDLRRAHFARTDHRGGTHGKRGYNPYHQCTESDQKRDENL